MMVYLLCFVAGLDAILIGLALVVRRPSNAEGSIQDRRHHHAGRINLMAAVALCFSVVGVLMWLLPRYRDEGALVEESPILGGMFVLMGLISAAGMVIAHRRQKLFDRRGR